MGGNNKNNRKRKKSKGSPPNKESENKRANVQSPNTHMATQTMQSANGQQVSYYQNGQNGQNGHCYTPGPIQNQNQSFNSFVSPGYNCIPMMNQSASPSFTQFPTQSQVPLTSSVFVTSDQFSALIQRLDRIDNKLTQLDGIQSSVKAITVRLDQIDKRVNDIEVKFKDIERSREYDSKNIDEIKKKHSEFDALKANIRQIEEQQKTLNTEVRHDITDIRSRSMRDNLLFFGIPEVRDSENREKDSDCVDKVLHIIETKMGIESAKETIKIHRAHRIGKYSQHKTRPIVAKFAYFPDRERVRQSYKKLERPYGVSQQYPPEMMETRKRLIPIMLETRKQQKEAYIVGD